MKFEIHTINVPMGNTTENLVAMIKFIEDDGKAILCPHNDLFNDSLLRSLLGNNILLKIKAVPGSNPFIITENVKDPATAKYVKNVNPVLETLLKIKKSGQLGKDQPIMKQLCDLLNNKNNFSFTVDELLELFDAYTNLQEYFKNTISIDMANVSQVFLTEDSNKALLDKYKLTAKIKDLWFLDDKINISVAQKTPEDKLFMKLPDYETLVTQDTSLGMVAELASLINPYREEVLKFKDMEPNKRPSNLLRTPQYATYVLKGDPSYDIKNVTGDPANNDLPIQENEKEFYEALCSLCDYTEKKKDAEEYKEQSLADSLTNPFFPQLNIDFKDLIVNIIAKALHINYSHTAFVPVTADTENEDILDSDDDSNSESDSAPNSIGSIYTFHQSNKNPSGQLATDMVLNYVESETGDPHSLCEAAVKLLRWGNRKPTKLKVAGANTYLSLDTFREEKSSGSFDIMELKLLDGCALRPSQIKLALNDNFTDRDFIRTLGFTPQRFGIPVGITTYKQYLSSGNESLVQTVHMSLIDLVYNLMTDVNTSNDKVFGYSFNQNTGKVEVDESVLNLLDKNVSVENAVVQVTTSTEGKAEFYQPGIVKDIFLKYNCWNATRCSVLSQINKYRSSNDLKVLNEFYSTNESELISLAQEGVVPAEALTINMFRQVLNVLCYVNDKVMSDLDRGIESSFVEVLNYYVEAMIKFKFNYGAFNEEGVSIAKNKLEDMMSGGANTTIGELNTFGSSEEDLEDDIEDNVAEVNGGWDMNNFIESVPAGVDAFRLYMNVMEPNKENIIDERTNTLKLVPGKKVIGAVHKITENGKDRYIILGFKDSKKYNLVSSKNPIPGLKNLSVDAFPDLFTNMIECVMTGNVSDAKVKFASMEVLAETISRFKSFSAMR